MRKGQPAAPSAAVREALARLDVLSRLAQRSSTDLSWQDAIAFLCLSAVRPLEGDSEPDASRDDAIADLNVIKNNLLALSKQQQQQANQSSKTQGDPAKATLSRVRELNELIERFEALNGRGPSQKGETKNESSNKASGK